MKEVKIYDKSFSGEHREGYVVYEIKPDYLIEVWITIEDVDTEYHPREKENGYTLHEGGYSVEKVYATAEIPQDECGYWIGDKDTSRSEFMKNAGMTESELEEVEKFVKENACKQCEGWAINNPDEVI